ncbi:MAG TPA: SpoIID/LytB domain-containing protein [Candidatus Brocadiia bacterium]|nr:SpoIID/LytB domain-containing protein [Candidatus Brocadiia bacterium]
MTRRGDRVARPNVGAAQSGQGGYAFRSYKLRRGYACALPLLAGFALIIQAGCTRRVAPPVAPIPTERLTEPARKPFAVRTLIHKDVDSIEIQVRGYWSMKQDGTELLLKRGKDLKETAEPSGAGIRLGDQRLPAANLRIESEGDRIVSVKGSNYHGSVILCRTAGGGLDVINECDPEAYVRSTLPAEMSPSWPEEALYAQAVALRSYVVYYIRSKAEAGHHLSGISAAYRGMSRESRRTNHATFDTRGMVLVWKDNYFPAYFHSTCAGHTADCSVVFSIASLPPLEGRRCPFCHNSPHSSWKGVSVARAELVEKLKADGVNVKDIESIRTAGAKGGDFHPGEVIINGSIRMNANRFRLLVGAAKLKSAAFDAKISGDKVVFSGKGWGHGVGLCQFGAKEMAQSGYNWKQILAFYYPEARLLKLYDDPDEATLHPPKS